MIYVVYNSNMVPVRVQPDEMPEIQDDEMVEVRDVDDLRYIGLPGHPLQYN